MEFNPIGAVRERTEAIKREKAAGVGEVGIFWFFKGEILPHSIPYTLGEEYGDFVNVKADHCSFWLSIQRHSPECAKYEYDQVPRGRVVYSKRDDKFFVYGSEQFVNDERRKAIIILEFHLPADRTVFRADEHYGDISGMAEG